MLPTIYRKHQKGQSPEHFALEDELIQAEEQKVNTARFLELIREYTDITELTRSTLTELVDKVVIHDAEEIDGKRTQS